MADGNGNGRMDRIEVALERLKERHEALTQSVEHLARQGEEQNSRIGRLLDVVEKLADIAQSHGKRLDQLED